MRKTHLLILVILVGAFFRLYQITTLPPGDGFDPAFYGVDALQILQGNFPVYLPTNFGREVLYSYLVAAMYLVVGPGTLGIHLVSAFVAILTIPAVFLVADEFFATASAELVQQYGGVVAALVTAVSFWHLAWSRYSVRAILIPLFVSLIFFFLLRGLRTRHYRAFIACGALLGLGLYTYQLAQLLPLVVVAAFVFDVAARRSLDRQTIAAFALVVGVSLLVFAPMGLYVVRHPDTFFQRTTGVLVLEASQSLGEQARILGERAWEVALMFGVRGDSDPLINIPERPSLNPFLAVGLGVGLLISLWRWRKPRYQFLLTWFLLLLAPAVLAEKAAMSKRSIGVIPVAAILVALALLQPLAWLRRSDKRLIREGAATLLALVIGGGLLYSGARTFRDYFLIWGQDPSLYGHFNVGVAEIGRFIHQLPEDEQIYLSPTWREDATLRLHSRLRTPSIHAYNGRHCFVFPQQTERPTTYVIAPQNDAISLPLLSAYFPQGTRTEGHLDNGDHYFTAYQIPAGVEARFQPAETVPANWENKIQLLGFDVESTTYRPGDTLQIHLYYKTLANMDAPYTIFIHLLGPEDPETGNVLWGQQDREPCYQSYPTTSWAAGEVIQDTFTLSIAPDAPPGNYQLTTGFYRWPDLTRLTLVQSPNETVAPLTSLKIVNAETQRRRGLWSLAMYPHSFVDAPAATP